MSKQMNLSSAIARAAAIVQVAALGTRYSATVQSVTDRETTGWVICDVFFRDPAADGRVTVRVNDAVDLAAGDLIYIKPDPAGQKTFTFDGFVKGGGTGHNDAGAYVPWTQSPGATSPVGMDYAIDPAAGQAVIIDGVNWSTFSGLEFVLMSADAAVANERALAGGDGISLADGGAGGNATLAVDLVAAWSGLEFAAGEIRVDLDAAFDFLGLITVGDLTFGRPTNQNEITIPDNVNDALHMVDSITGDEYLGFRTAAQKQILFNQDEVDIDFRVSTSGVTDGLLVQGSDNYVGIGITPIWHLHISGPGKATRVRIRVGNSDPVAVANKAGFDFTALTTVQSRSFFYLEGNFSDTVDATRTSSVGFYHYYQAASRAAMLMYGNSVVFNEDGADVDLRGESANEDKLMLLDAGTDQFRLGDGDTNYFVTNNLGDTRWVGGGGLPFGSFWGNEIGWSSVAFGGGGTWVEIAGAGITAGQLHNVVYQGDKELDIGATAGMYLVNYSITLSANAANKHILGGIGVDAGGAGALTVVADGQSHIDTRGAGNEATLGGTAILDLSANSEVGLMVTNEDDNTQVDVQHLSLTIVQIGGT